MLYAIIEDSGRQFWLNEGETIWIDFRKDKKPGDTIEFDKVLLLRNNEDVKIGRPYLEGVKVIAEVLEHVKSRKIRVFKYKPKTGYHKTKGHRQKYTAVKVKQFCF